MSSRRRRSVLGLRASVPWRLVAILALILVVALALSGALGSLQGGVLLMLPTVVLTIVMLASPYPGEGVIAELRARAARRTPSRTALPTAPLRPRTCVARGGRLIAVALAGRAPPLASAGCR